MGRADLERELFRVQNELTTVRSERDAALALTEVTDLELAERYREAERQVRELERDLVVQRRATALMRKKWQVAEAVKQYALAELNRLRPGQRSCAKRARAIPERQRTFGWEDAT